MKYIRYFWNNVGHVIITACVILFLPFESLLLYTEFASVDALTDGDSNRPDIDIHFLVAASVNWLSGTMQWESNNQMIT